MQHRNRKNVAMPEDFRQVMSSLGTSVSVVATRTVDGAPVGMTVNSFNSVSLDPPLVLWCIRLGSQSFAAFRDAPRFSVSVLNNDQLDIAHRFAQPVKDKFDGVKLHPDSRDLPLLAECSAYFECSVTTVHLEGDHAIFIGRVERCRDDPALTPLIFHRGKKIATTTKSADRISITENLK